LKSRNRIPIFFYNSSLTEITRNDIIAQNCKIYDAIEKDPEDQVSFLVGVI